MAGATIACAREEGERLRRIIQATACCWQPTEGIRIKIGITASIGVAASALHGMQCKELLNQADQAMYEAKMAGRNCVRVAGETPASCQ